jgi:hypothetical protein
MNRLDLDRTGLKAMRGARESYSEVIIRVAMD